jgi:hypothetical protein
MIKTATPLLTAALLCFSTLALAGADARPEPDGAATEQMRERPDNAPSRSRYPDTDIDKGPASVNKVQPPDDGSAMDMNDLADGVNDSELEMPRPNPNR